MSNTEITYTEPAVKFHQYQRRRALLPWWIKIFCWLFMLAACIVPFGIIARIMHYPTDFEMFGIGSHDPFSAQGAIAMLIILFNGITALLLWAEWEKAIMVAKINAIINIGICVIVMGYFLIEKHNINFRLELILLALFLYKLNNIQYKWENLDTLGEGVEYTDPAPVGEQL